ncbi:MAG: Heteropolysaccharide repeat-containing protein [Candidatus Peregrinibacteria bacterium Greene0416_62]|nr:MAG: Heteropolysaccharide repeat-containing protein [Candidatus Peregrinibacteria bacterium Greene0416_62]TSC99820.1 MAG: Heteropolysaccharide repeat-containing protein [Candidatus Peregrinibacteria bacterium Greene1014_49]
MAALSILTVKFVAIGLSKELAGNYNSAYGFLQLFGILADFGLYAVGVREMARAKDRASVLGALLVIRTVILILSLTLALALVWFLPQWRGTPLPLSVTVAALVPLFTLLAGIFRTVFQIHHRMQYVFAAEVTQRVITTVLIGLFIIAGVRGSQHLSILYTFLLIGGIGAFVLLVISLLAARRFEKIQWNTNRTIMVSILRRSIPFGAAFLCMALYRQLDVTMIALLRPDFEIQNAEYGFVLRMVEMGYVIPTFLLNSVLPTLSERDERGEDTAVLLGKTLMILLLLGIIAGLFCAFWSRPLVQLLTTDAYLSTPEKYGSDTALMLMGLPVFLNGLVQYGFYVLLNRGRSKPLIVVLGLGAALSIGLNYALIPLYGYIGATITSNAVHLILAVALMIAALRTMPVKFPLSSFVKILLFAWVLGMGLWGFAPLLQNEIATVVGLIVASLGMLMLIPMLGIHTMFFSPRPLQKILP